MAAYMKVPAFAWEVPACVDVSSFWMSRMANGFAYFDADQPWRPAHIVVMLIAHCMR